MNGYLLLIAVSLSTENWKLPTKKREMFTKRKNKTYITIAEILRGTEAGRMQSVGYMQIIPLVSDLQDENFVTPDEATVQTTNYGSMVFDNPTNGILIVPTHAGYVVKQAAQNHAMAHTGLVRKGKTKTYNTAMCVQQNQGGYISKGKHRLSILPFALREKALEKRNQKSYSKLWKDISTFNTSLGLANKGHLEYFLNHFEKELGQFVAEFECVPKQVGAVILLNGEIIGIERAPNYAYWKSVWSALIRECYGSRAIEYQYKMGSKTKTSKSRFPIDDTNIKTLEDLKAALKDAESREEEFAKTALRELLDKPFQVSEEDSTDGYSVSSIKHEQFIGEIVHDGDVIAYASLLTRATWSKKSGWKKAKAFSI